MKIKRIAAFFSAFVIMSASLNPQFAAAYDDCIANAALEDEVLSGSAAEAYSVEAAADYSGGYIVKIKDDNNINLFSTDSNSAYGFITTDSLEEAEMYIKQGIAEYIEPDYEVELYSVPDDTLYSEQWHHGTINSQNAWDLELYGDDVNIAVIDSGCYKHEDISGNLLEGYNYLENNTDTTDNLGHGTHVSGIIAAEMNSCGIVGIANNAKIVPLKCFENYENTRISDVIPALYDAVDKYDCHIINMSWGVDANSAVLYEAVNYAYNKGAILIAAAGNSGTSVFNYPASYDCVIGVGSVAADKTVSYFSEHNSSVFAVAPGENILSLGIDGGYALSSGTSHSAPMVVSLAAILMSIDNNMTTEKFKECIINSAEDLGTAGYDNYYGYGLIDVGKAVRYKLRDESYYISDITCNDGNINFGIWNNTDEALTGILIVEAYYNTYSRNIDTSQINISPGETQVYKFSCSGDYDNIKCFIWNSLEDMIPINKTGTYNDTEINITNSELDESGNITLECAVTNSVDNQQISIMVVKYNNDSFDYENAVYYNQLDYRENFKEIFNSGIYENGTYALRAGGTNISSPAFVLISYNNAEIDNSTKAETTTELTTSDLTETTTAETTATETTTAAAKASSSSGGGGGGGGSSSSASVTTTTTTEATTVETTVETTTEEQELITEEDDEEIKPSSLISEIKVTIGSDLIFINEKAYNIEAAAYIQSESNSTLVPLRFVAVAILGGNVENADLDDMIIWDSDTKTAKITALYNVIEFTAGSSYMTVNGKKTLMNNGVCAEITNNRMFIPFRALGEALGITVEWNGESKTAIYKN